MPEPVRPRRVEEMRLRRCSHSETFCVNGFLAWLLLLMTTPSDLAVFLVRESWRQKDVTWTSELAIEWTEVTSTHANSCHGTWTNLGHLTSPQWDLLAKLVMPHVEAILLWDNPGVKAWPWILSPSSTSWNHVPHQILLMVQLNKHSLQLMSLHAVNEFGSNSHCFSESYLQN